MKIGSSQRYFQPARVNFYIYKLNSRDSSPIYGVSVVRFFMLLFSSTVKILKFGTPQTIAIIVLKIDKFDVTLH